MAKKSRVYNKSSFGLTPGMQGILVTCNRGREKRAYDELVQMIDLLEDEETVCQESLEDAMKQELKGLKKKNHQRVQLGEDVQCFVFVKCIEPTELVLKLFKADLNFHPKFCQRLIPLERICYANFEQLLDTARSFIPPNFKEDASFAVIFEKRLNDSLDRSIVTRSIAEFAKPSKVDLENPKKVIMLQVLKNIVGMSVLENYHAFKKMNISEHFNKD